MTIFNSRFAKQIIPLFIFLLLSAGSFAQKGYFKAVSSAELKGKDPKVNNIKNAVYLQLDEQALRSYLLQAPMEFKNNGRTIPLEIPLPNGKTEYFNMVESPILSDKQAALHPEMKTYTGNGQTNKKSVIRLSLTSDGFNAIILNMDGDAVYFEKSASQPNTYFSYFTKDAMVPVGPKQRSCNMDINMPVSEQQKEKFKRLDELAKNQSALSSTGTTLTTFRLAMPADAEFVAHNGGTVTSGFNAVFAYVNRIVAFYRNELSVSFVLVSGTNMIYTNAVTDPYNNDDQGQMLDQNLANCDAVLGSANYDVGHVWGYVGFSGGGVAARGSVCDNGEKGRGTSGEGDLSTYSQVFMDQLVFHELGHQFNMTHSYNSSIPVCTTRAAATSVEPGSGATVMSYGFTCNDGVNDDDYFSAPVGGLYTGPILQFHSANYEQAVAFMSTISCGVATSTGNTPPVVTVPSNFTIPKSTPFALTGSATDANGDALTYCWEGTNVGTMVPDGTTLANTAQPPFFRSYQPTTSGTRIYPILSSILDGSNYVKGDKLPSVGIATTHTLTVRDNNAAGGGVSNASVTVTVNGAIGPFLETTNLSGTYAGLSNQTITWSVNGTAAATPNVKISLSTDGGFTFPTVLAASTANDGSELVTLPNVTTATARIKVEAVGNIFFDISNADFSINAVVVNYTITASAGANGSISPSGAVSVVSGANQSFSITPNAGFAIADVLVDGGSVGTGGTYTFTNVTANHTISASFVAIVVNYTITASAAANGSISPSGAVSVVSGANQSFSITPNAGFAIADVLVDGGSVGTGGTYTFTNVTANHTISASFVAVVVNYTITASAGANGSISPSGAVIVVSGANQSFSITPNAGYNIADVLVDGGSVGTGGTYTFTNVTANHTISASFVIIGVTCAVTGSGTTTPVSCFGGNNGTATVTLAGTGSGAPGTYTVDGGSSQAYTTNPFTATGLTAGNHTIVATVTAGGCVSSNIVVNVGTPAATFSATFVKTNRSQCSGVPDGSITVTPVGGTAPYTYSWTGETGSNHTPFTAGNVSSLTGLNYGYYNVTVMDAGGCGIVTLSNIHVEIGYLVYVTNSGTVSSLCSPTGSISLYGNAGLVPYTYSLNGTTYQPGNTFTGLAAGDYTAYVKDNGGCISTKLITVGSSTALVINPFVKAATSCSNDGSVQIFRTGGYGPYTYSLVPGTSAPAGTYGSNNLFTGLAAGAYTAYVKDGGLCVSSANVTVTQGAALTLTLSKVNTSTCVNDGQIQAIPAGGTAPYTYSIDGTNFQASSGFGGLGQGVYTVTVKDAKGCTGTANATILFNTIVVTASATPATSCASNNGKIQLFRTGGYGPFMYSLDGNTYQAGNTFTNVAAGTYTGFVKDAKTCTGSLTGIVVGPTGCVNTFAGNTTGNAQARGQQLVAEATVLTVQAYPNPSRSEFAVILSGYNYNEKVLISVTDILGRKVVMLETNAGKQKRIGKELKAGIYFMEVVQGNNKQVVKLVKE
jgi:hypothetical protein